MSDPHKSLASKQLKGFSKKTRAETAANPTDIFLPEQ
jgi:hypothetical protein